MKKLLLIAIWASYIGVFGQQDERISTLDFVQILDGNTEEAHFYYQNNWKKFRDTAVDKGYIHSYEILETTPSDDAPFHLLLITTYANEKAYEKREGRFTEVIEQAGALQLLNDKKPGDFRKNLFNKELVKHWKTRSNP